MTWIEVVFSPWLWAIFTIIASISQTWRNAMQHGLTETLGTAGATYVRFLFGWPFACLFFLIVVSISGLPPTPSLAMVLWTSMGAMMQILATALMLEAMRARSFVVTIAYTKTEPVQVAVFALIFLGEQISVMLASAILVATAGVMIMSLKKGSGSKEPALKPALLGIGSGALFAMAAVGYRGGILALKSSDFVLSATTTLLIALTIQTVFVLGWLVATSPRTLGKILRSWRPSMTAGFFGAFASQMWFLAFALEAAARVRTLALIEIIFAWVVSRRLFSQSSGGRDYFGIALVIFGVVLLLNS